MAGWIAWKLLLSKTQIKTHYSSEAFGAGEVLPLFPCENPIVLVVTEAEFWILSNPFEFFKRTNSHSLFVRQKNKNKKHAQTQIVKISVRKTTADQFKINMMLKKKIFQLSQQQLWPTRSAAGENMRMCYKALSKYLATKFAIIYQFQLLECEEFLL